ncbi:MAG TPA: methylamine utilization protein [Steroidobacteraceae bacterium]|nr:methylamine utilization protein [Steroidobacteraceae bacterium]
MASGRAASISVSVLDRDNRGVGDIVVTATPRGSTIPPPASTPRAIMDQVDKQFVPHVLVVRVGTEVAFPNSDTVAHQVYSFSAAKRFQLALYRGHAHPPLVFDKPGVVVLGCNIHDNMLAYIFVTPAPYFGRTDPTGKLELVELPAGEYDVVLWSPRINEPPATLTRSIRLAEAQELPIPVRLTRPLSPEPRAKPPKSSWDDY